MSRFLGVLTAAAICAAAAPAWAQSAPRVRTVPWVAGNPAIPHDILSGDALDAFDDTSIGGVEVAVLSTCGNDVQAFSLNGVAVGQINGGNSCTCTPQVQRVATAAPAALAAWDAGGVAVNDARVVKSTTGTYLAWAKMQVTLASGGVYEACIFDRTGSNCTAADLCGALSTASVDATVTGFGPAGGDAQATRIKALVEDVDGDLATVTFAYGDGEPDTVANIGGDRAVVESRHTYRGAAAGSPFTATVTACDSGGRCASAPYRMVVRDDSLETRTNIAIDEGLWALFKVFDPDTGQIRPPGSYGDRISATAAAVNAFAVHGHRVDGNSASNPYIDAVAGGLDYVFARLQSQPTANQAAGDPDGNGNGRYLTGGGGQEVYENGMLMDAIVSGGRPDAVVTVGPAAGQTHAAVVQDLVDGYAQGQMDAHLGSPQRGSWYYTFTTSGHADNSSSQWAAIGIIPAERQWQGDVPDFVRDENLLALAATFNDLGDECATFGYADRNCIWGCAATTPSGMVQLVMDGVEPGDAPGAPFAAGVAPYDKAARWLAQNWGAGPGEGDTNLVSGYTYGLFAAVKALRLAGVDLLVRDAAGCGGGGADTAFDWYHDPAVGVAHTLVERQRADGTFGGPGVTDIGGLYTQWSLIMLAPQLFQQGPKAVAEASPITVTINQAVSLRHRDSFHLDDERVIVLYEWDLDDDGQYDDYSTADANAGPSVSFAQVGTHTLRLRVTDDNAPPLTDTAEVRVTVSVDNVPPVAIVTPAVISVARDTVVALDGSASFDPNAGPPLDDFITRYEWDLDPSDGLTQFAVGGVGNSVSFAQPGTYRVALRVTDSGPGGTTPLRAVGFADITVVENQPPVAVALPDGAVFECIDGGAAVALDGAGSSDPDGDALSYAWQAGVALDDPGAAVATGVFGLGAHAATLTVSDGSEADSDGARFSVVDTAGPTVVCDDAVAECEGVATAVDVGAAAHDACEGALAVAADEAGPFALGETPVVFTAVDGSGNDGRCVALVEVIDTLPPAIECPPDVVVEADAACVGHADPAASADDVCAGPVETARVPADTAWPLGTTAVTHSAEDGDGNTSACESRVTVVDATPPTVACNAHDITPRDAPVRFTATAEDNCAVAVQVVGYDCWAINGAGQRRSKLDSCVVAIDGGTLTVVDAGGVGAHIEWTARATDADGNVAEARCALEVHDPGQGGGSGCNQGVGNGPEGCDPGNSNQGDPANSNDESGGGPGGPGKGGGQRR